MDRDEHRLHGGDLDSPSGRRPPGLSQTVIAQSEFEPEMPHMSGHSVKLSGVRVPECRPGSDVGPNRHD